jgi:ketosteroid isomerase-like protein
MVDKRARAREFLDSALVRSGWTEAIDDGMDPQLRALNLRLVELLLAGDLDGVMEMASPTLVVTQPPELPGARTYRGREGLLEAFIDWPSQWADTTIEPVRTWQAAPDVTITQNHQTVRAAESGLELEADFWFVNRWRDGMLYHWSMHVTREDAERFAQGG